MRVLLDECVPRQLRRDLEGFDVKTVQEMGWAGVKNGALLSLRRLESIRKLFESSNEPETRR
jgi:hypothetical protein